MEFFFYDSLAFQNFLKANPHEGAEVEFLKSVAKEGMTVIDVGANIGITTVTIAKKIGGKGKVYAFEPLSGYFDVLKKNLSANGLKNAKAFELALVDRVGRIDFYENRRDNLNNWQTAAVYRLTLADDSLYMLHPDVFHLMDI